MNVYEVYHGKTGELLFTGSARECYKALGMFCVENFYHCVSQANKGRYKKYVFKKYSGLEYWMMTSKNEERK